MRLDGMTFEEIGNHFGVSRYYVREAFKVMSETKSIRVPTGIIYPNLEKWIIENRCGRVNALAREVYEGLPNNISSFYGKLRGKRSICMREIRRILEITGLTFEEAFEERREVTE